jgi:hypothetical protein
MGLLVLKAAASTAYAGAGGIVPAAGGDEAECAGARSVDYRQRRAGKRAPSQRVPAGVAAVPVAEAAPARARGMGRGGKTVFSHRRLGIFC